MNPTPDTPPIPDPARDFAAPAIPATSPSPDDVPTPDAKLWLWPLALLALVQLGAPLVPVPNVAAALAGVVLLTLVYVGGVVAFSLGMARQKFPLPVLLGALAGCGGLYVVGQVVLAHSMWSGVFQSFALLGLGTFGGLLLSRFIRYANMIGPIGVMVALIDIWGVLLGGIVFQLLNNKSTRHVAQHAMASGPKLGAATGNAKFALGLPDIGIGDYLFLALFLGALVRFGMNWRASSMWMWVLVSLALLLIILPTGIPALPGLLFLGAGAVLPNLRYFQFTRDERFALLYAGVFVLLLTVGLYLGLTSMLPKH